MKVIIDSNSLLSLVRYYLPFDKNFVLFNFIKAKLEEGEFIIIDKVHTQCQYLAKGIVLEKLEYLTDKTFLKACKLPHKTDALLAPSPARFLRMVDNQFVYRAQKNKISAIEYDTQKSHYMEDADMKQIILCLNMKNNGEDIAIVTEESETNNDNKLFKKIPSICKDLDITTMTFPELLGLYQAINLEFKRSSQTLATNNL